MLLQIYKGKLKTLKKLNYSVVKAYANCSNKITHNNKTVSREIKCGK